MRRAILTWLLAITVGLGLFAAGAAWPFFYNRNVHPIGKMSSRIHIGDSCDAVFLQFSEYARSNGTEAVQFGRSTTTTSLLSFNHKVDESEIVWLYDVNIFDDLQIEVRCDRQDGRVLEKRVVLD